MEKKEVIGNPLTRQGALCNRSERQGDSPRVIDNPLTCQGALCNRSKRQGDDNGGNMPSPRTTNIITGPARQGAKM